MINAAPILEDLKLKIKSFDVSDMVYLKCVTADIQGRASVSVLDMNSFGIQEGILPEILHVLGIRSLTMSKHYDLTNLHNIHFELPAVAIERYPWIFLRNKELIFELQLLFKNCQTISFDNWSGKVGASDLWNGLLEDVIKPVERKDLEFIFYLGDPQEKLSFQVDEVLDIISDFSYHGKVTFALEEDEAVKLWMVLNGVKRDSLVNSQTVADRNRKFMSVFKTLNVTRLVIYSKNKAMLFSKKQQFTLGGIRIGPTMDIAGDARENFVAGFSISLMLQLDITHCLALGLVVFGSFGEQKALLDQAQLIIYIDQWISDLQRPETIYLYQ